MIHVREMKMELFIQVLVLFGKRSNSSLAWIVPVCRQTPRLKSMLITIAYKVLSVESVDKKTNKDEK